ncbi:hypothetical protein [Sphingopyxis kveilinensis]|uniref:hypothetical protein n=1 Tax=Sphingopyxis kveilinensis TaxID=3114367 RepID=UPI0030D01592
MVSKIPSAVHPSIKAGNWYFGVTCKKCEKHIAVEIDPSNGKTPHQWPVGVVLVGHCYHCDHSAEYVGFASKKADEDRPSVIDKRPKPTNQQPYPFLPKHSKLMPYFGHGAIEMRPEFGLIIARIISLWSSLETQTARILSRAMGAHETEAGIAVYLSLRNARAKREALDAATSASFNAADNELVLAFSRWRASLETHRNCFAHYLIGIAPGLNDALLVVPPEKYSALRIKVTAGHDMADIERQFRGGITVYPIGVAERIARDIENLTHSTADLVGYLGDQQAARRAERYRQLCLLPRIKEELDRHRAQNTRAKR